MAPVLERVMERVKKSNYYAMRNNPANDKIPVVLFLSGAFSPDHRMNIELLKEVRKWLNKRRDEFKYEVIAALMSPLHDHFLYCKHGPTFLAATHRLKMCELAVKEVIKLL